jgi:hypothetical protein
VLATALILAQPDRDYTRIFVWSLALLGVLAVGLLVVSKVKRRLQEPDAPVSAGFTLSDLRQLHKSGQMTDEEFERAKAKVVEAARKAAERDAKPPLAGRARGQLPGMIDPSLGDKGGADEGDAEGPRPRPPNRT